MRRTVPASQPACLFVLEIKGEHMTQFIADTLEIIWMLWITLFLLLTSPVWLWFYLVYRAVKFVKEKNT